MLLIKKKNLDNTQKSRKYLIKIKLKTLKKNNKKLKQINKSSVSSTFNFASILSWGSFNIRGLDGKMLNRIWKCSISTKSIASEECKSFLKDYNQELKERKNSGNLILVHVFLIRIPSSFHSTPNQLQVLFAPGLFRLIQQ